MPPPREAPIPIEALRDLIGLCRALYLAWRTNGAGPVELDELASIGRDLRSALKLAKSTKPDTVGHRAAWSRAEDATRRLGHVVSALEPLKPTVEAAARRVCGEKGRGVLEEREARKRHARMRG